GIRDFHVTGVQTCALPISGCAIRRGAKPSKTSNTIRLKAAIASRACALESVSKKPHHTDCDSARINARLATPSHSIQLALERDSHANGNISAAQAANNCHTSAPVW